MPPKSSRKRQKLGKTPQIPPPSPQSNSQGSISRSSGSSTKPQSKSTKTKSKSTKPNSSSTKTKSTKPPSSTPTVLGRKNRLDDIFSSQQSESRQSMFEEDEGFVYKRGMETPVSKMNRALDELENDNPPDQSSAGSNRLSSPIRPEGSSSTATKTSSRPKSGASSARRAPFVDTSDSSYEEHVTHHTIDLQGPESLVPGPLAPSEPAGRRTSYNNRGKRILSIGNGFVGTPHDDVSPKEYYKLLDGSMPEPQKMKQLLLWCLNYKLDNETNDYDHKPNDYKHNDYKHNDHKHNDHKPNDYKHKHQNQNPQIDSTVKNIAKVIKGEVIEDLRNGNITTSWYDRPPTHEEVGSKEIVLPNPLNKQAKEGIKVYKKELDRLIKERKEWAKVTTGTATTALAESKDEPNESGTKVSTGLTRLNHLKSLKPNVSSSDIEVESLESPLNSVADQSLINQMDEIHKDITNLPNKIETSIDKLHLITYQMKKVYELIEQYKNSQLEPKVSNLIKEYINKWKYQGENDSMWTTGRLLGVEELLRGIAKIEAGKESM